MKLLVTGGAGFIGSNFIHYILKKYPASTAGGPDYKIINLDLLTYAGNQENLKDIENDPRYQFVKGDIADEKLAGSLMKDVDVVVNFAAESHVDRSITDPGNFLRTNVIGTSVLLDAAKKNNVPLFVQIGTDEEYGSRKTGYFRESDPLSPSSPYSSSKAAASMLALSYFKTYKLPVIVIRPTNNFGPYQFPEKVIPLFLTNLFDDKPVPLYGYGLNRRDWLFVEDNCRAIDLIIHKGKIGEIYNVGDPSNEISNVELTSMILERLGKPASMIQFVKDRLGHDFRYAVDSEKIRALGFEPLYDLEKGLDATIKWYRDNESWWRKLKGQDFKEYYKKHYDIPAGGKDKNSEPRSFPENEMPADFPEGYL